MMNWCRLFLRQHLGRGGYQLAPFFFLEAGKALKGVGLEGLLHGYHYKEDLKILWGL